MLHYTRLERYARDKHSRLLLGSFISYRGNKVWWVQPHEFYLQHFNFFVTYEWDQEVCNCLSLRRLLLNWSFIVRVLSAAIKIDMIRSSGFYCRWGQCYKPLKNFEMNLQQNFKNSWLLQSCNFTNRKLISCKLTNCNLATCKFHMCKIAKCKFTQL